LRCSELGQDIRKVVTAAFVVLITLVDGLVRDGNDIGAIDSSTVKFEQTRQTLVDNERFI
jgi:hypothetical protein